MLYFLKVLLIEELLKKLNWRIETEKSN